MGILRVTCSNCNTTLKSTKTSGFEEGEVLECPKCGTYFAAEAQPAAKPLPAKPVPAKVAAQPAPKKPVKPQVVDDEEDDEDDEKPRKRKPRDDEDDDEDDEKPKKKKKKKGRRDEPERSYKNSPVRFIILGILVVIMIVLGVLLYLKMQKDKENAQRPAVPVSIS